MNYKQAIHRMKKGAIVESVVSYTQYEINDDGQLLAEGTLVKEEYVTKEEREGEFRMANVIYYDKSSDDEIDEFMDKSYKHALFIQEHEEIKRKNMIS